MLAPARSASPSLSPSSSPMGSYVPPRSSRAAGALLLVYSVLSWTTSAAQIKKRKNNKGAPTRSATLQYRLPRARSVPGG